MYFMGNDLIENATSICSKQFGIKETDLYGATRKEYVVIIRHILWYMLHVDFGIPISAIRKGFFRKDRSIFYAINKIKSGVKNQKLYYDLYLKMLNECKNNKLCFTKI